MFPRGGIHWNSLATALGTQKVIAAVNAPRPEHLRSTDRDQILVDHQDNGQFGRIRWPHEVSP